MVTNKPTLRCPLCLAPLTLRQNPHGLHSFVCSRYPYGFWYANEDAQSLERCIREAPSVAVITPRFAQYQHRRMYHYIKHPTNRGWSIQADEAVQDPLLDLIEDSKGDDVSNGEEEW